MVKFQDVPSVMDIVTESFHDRFDPAKLLNRLLQSELAKLLEVLWTKHLTQFAEERNVEISRNFKQKRHMVRKYQEHQQQIDHGKGLQSSYE